MAQLEKEEQLQKIFTNVNDWLKFAEAKNFGLITFNAAVIFGICQIDPKGNYAFSIPGAFFIIIASFAILSCLISLLPILTKIEKGHKFSHFISKISNCFDKEKPFENIHFYGYLKYIDIEKFVEKFNSKTNNTEDFNGYEKDLVNQILYNSRITSLKYQLFKIAGYITIIGAIACVLLILSMLFIEFFIP